VKNISIKNKLILFFLIPIILPLLLSTIITLTRVKSVLEQNYRNSAIQTLNLLNKRIEDTLMTYEKVAFEIIGNQELNNVLMPSNSIDNIDVEFVNNVVLKSISNLVLAHKYIDSIFIQDTKGEKYYYNKLYNKNSIQNLDSDKMSWYEDIKNGVGKLLWKNVPIINDSGEIENRLILGGLIKDRSKIYLDKTIAYLVIDINNNAIYDLYKDVKISKNGFLVLLDDKGTMCFSPTTGLINKYILQNLYDTELSLKRSGALKWKIEGKEFNIVFETLEHTDWKLIAAIPSTDIDLQIVSIERYFYFISIIFGIVALILTFIISNSITQPIKQLRKNMKKVEHGDLDCNIKIKSFDEIGELSESFNNMVSKLKSLIKEAYEVKMREQDAQIRAIQAQLNPHFLYNTLDTINWMAILQGAEKASEMITCLSDLLRYSISKTNECVTIRDEINQIHNYIAIQKERYGDKFVCNIKVDENILDYKVFKLFLQPIVENAIIHGIHDLDEQGILEIEGYMKAEDNTLVFNVIDNGIGMKQTQIMELLSKENPQASDGYKGIGVTSIDRRIKLTYGDGFGIKIESFVGKGTKVLITIPANL